MSTAVVLDGHSLTLDDVVSVAVDGATVELLPAARALTATWSAEGWAQPVVVPFAAARRSRTI